MTLTIDVPAEPSAFPIVAGRTALIVIDMQRDFLLPGGFGESLGNDVNQLLKVVPPLAALIAAARAAGVMVIHTREGHQPDLADCPPRQAQSGGSALEAHRRPGKVRPHPDPGGRVRPRHRRRTRPDRRRGRHRQAGQGRVLRHRAVRGPHKRGYHPAAGHGRHHRGVCAHHHPRGQRPRIRMPRRIRLCRFVFPGVSAHRAGDDQAQGGIFGWVADTAAVIPALGRLTTTPPVQAV